MVQKLDVALTLDQVTSLFAPLRSSGPATKTRESLTRVNALVRDLVRKNPENQARIEAVFKVIKQGIAGNPDFLTIEGATAYHRTAFETTTGLQTTVDRDQGVYSGNMYQANGSLKDPILTTKTNTIFRPESNDSRHVELKVPVTSMANTAGITFADPLNAPKPQDSGNDDKIKQILSVYHRFVRNNRHAGKFNYLRENGVTE